MKEYRPLSFKCNLFEGNIIYQFSSTSYYLNSGKKKKGGIDNIGMIIEIDLYDNNRSCEIGIKWTRDPFPTILDYYVFSSSDVSPFNFYVLT